MKKPSYENKQTNILKKHSLENLHKLNFKNVRSRRSQMFHIIGLLEVGLSPSKKNYFICFSGIPLKMMKIAFYLFHLKRSFLSQDI